jgi:hypothetical protein
MQATSDSENIAGVRNGTIAPHVSCELTDRPAPIHLIAQPDCERQPVEVRR